jgi:hypothetical protein
MGTMRRFGPVVASTKVRPLLVVVCSNQQPIIIIIIIIIIINSSRRQIREQAANKLLKGARSGQSTGSGSSGVSWFWSEKFHTWIDRRRRHKRRVTKQSSKHARKKRRKPAACTQKIRHPRPMPILFSCLVFYMPLLVLF